jgi:uncharacterized protein (DUF433 family)
MEGTNSQSFQALITCDPAVMVGKPCIRGTRITVESVLEMLGSGMTVAEIVSDYPSLSPVKIQAALQYAAHHLRKGSAA